MPSWVDGGMNGSGSSVTIPPHQIGDLLVIVAVDDGTTIPSLPTGWTSVYTSSTTCGRRVGYKIATSTSDSSGTWTGANRMACGVWRGFVSVGAVASSASSSALADYPAVTANGPNSWLAAFAIGDNTPGIAAGMISRYNVYESFTYVRISDSNGVDDAFPGSSADEVVTVALELVRPVYTHEQSYTVAEISAVTPVLSTLTRCDGDATATSSSSLTGYGPENAQDGVFSAVSEWRADGTTGEWIRYTWDEPVSVNMVRLFDRSDTGSQITSGTLTFSDGGAPVAVGALNDGGSLTEVTFTARQVTWVQFTVDTVKAGTTAAGLQEWQVFPETGVVLLTLDPVEEGVTVATEQKVLSPADMVGQFVVEVFDRAELAEYMFFGGSLHPVFIAPRMKDVRYLDELNADGGGSVSLPLDDVVAAGGLVRYGAVVRVSVSDTVIGWFEIEKITVEQVGDEPWVTVAGPGPLSWTSRGVLYPVEDPVPIGKSAPTVSTVTTGWSAYTGTKTTDPFTVAEGDVLVVIVSMGDDHTYHAGTPTNSGVGLTWTELAEIFDDKGVNMRAFSATVGTDHTSIAVSVAWAGSTPWGFTVFRCQNTDGVGVVDTAHDDSYEPPADWVLTQSQNSALLCGVAAQQDVNWVGWQPLDRGTQYADVVTRDWVPGWTFSNAVYHDSGAIGMKKVGFMWPVYADWSVLVVEVTGVTPTTSGVTWGPMSKNRRFDFTSPNDQWYESSEWVTPTIVASVDPLTSDPEDWPDWDTSTKWVWDRASNMPLGDVYLRCEFTTATDSGCEVFATVRDVGVIVLDGEVLITMDEENAWEKTARATLSSLPAGNHVLAIQARNVEDTLAGVAVLLTTKPADPDDAGTVIVRTGTTSSAFASAVTWVVCGYPDMPPGWTVGQLMVKIMSEAWGRDVDGLNRLPMDGGADVDAYLRAWLVKLSWVFTVGTTYRKIFEKIIESAADVWVGTDLRIRAASIRGVDRSDSVLFAPGFNLTRVTSEPTGISTVTELLIEQDGQFIGVSGPTGTQSVHGRREAFMTAPNDGTMELVVAKVWRDLSAPQQHPTLEIVPRYGAIPWVNFETGDWVSGPSDDDPTVSTKRRVVSIAVSQDAETGAPRYEIELDSVGKMTEEEHLRELVRATSGLLGYFAAPQGQQAPERVILGSKRVRRRARGWRRCPVCLELIPHKDSHAPLHQALDDLDGRVTALE